MLFHAEFIYILMVNLYWVYGLLMCKTFEVQSNDQINDSLREHTYLDGSHPYAICYLLRVFGKDHVYFTYLISLRL